MLCADSGVDELVSGGPLTVTSCAPLCSDNAPILSDMLDMEPVPELGDGGIADIVALASLENI